MKEEDLLTLDSFLNIKQAADVVVSGVKNKNSFAHALDRALYILYNIIAKKAMGFANYTAIFS